MSTLREKRLLPLVELKSECSWWVLVSMTCDHRDEQLGQPRSPEGWYQTIDSILGGEHRGTHF